MNATKSAVMITLFSSMCQGEKHYTVTSVDKIIINLEKYHNIHVKRRWIFYCLSAMLLSGLAYNTNTIIDCAYDTRS
jgi:hypothetical protein